MSNFNKSKLALISMIRNEFDIISPFIQQALNLFDSIYLVDISSTDGTAEVLSEIARNEPKLKVFSVDKQEKFQSALMNLLARKAFAEGADWVFLLDADEFLNIESRELLEKRLHSFSAPVMHLPWINLIPSHYGDFIQFNCDQDFYWSGRVSKYNKVAISSKYALTHPKFYINEGNHNVSSSYNAEPSPVSYGIPLLHIPIRSPERFQHKIEVAWNTLISKENRLPGEGEHVIRIKEMFDSGVFDDQHLNYLAGFYGDSGKDFEELNPRDLNWPKKQFPRYLFANPVKDFKYRISLSQMVSKESSIKWVKSQFSKGSVAMALLQDESKIEIIPHPMLGSGDLYLQGFDELTPLNPALPNKLDMHLLIQAMDASFLKIEEAPFSAWSELVPALFALFAILRPRRYVELGSHYGMSFFGACQAAKFLNLNTQCVAIDSWIGDVHAGFHSTEVFDGFRSVLSHRHPDQFYIRGFFAEARKCFADASVDLLHIDGLHTYEAVKEDFETWLPKMSGSGVIIFHDINVFDRGFGVWRLWKELTEQYPHFHLSHMHGLGILYVGSQKSVISELFSLINGNTQLALAVQNYFQSIGKLSVNAVHEEKSKSLLTQECHTLREQHHRFEEELSLLKGARDASLKVWANLCVNIQSRKKQGIVTKLINLMVGNRLIKEVVDRKIIKAIKNSNLFDEKFYFNAYPDIKNSGVNPIRHFVKSGVYEFRNPNADFDCRGYLLKNEDVMLAGINPFFHYITSGITENRRWN